MKLFLSKYALSGQIIEVTLDGGSAVGRALVNGALIYTQEHGWNSFKLGRDIHLTREEAVAAAEAARDKKLKSLQKQMDALRKKVFA